MTYFDTLQQNLGQSSPFGQFGPQQWGTGAFGPQGGQQHGGGGLGLGQAAYGQQYGQFGGGQPTFGAFGYGPGWGGQTGWGQQHWGGQQRQLSPQDVNEVVRQLVPALPQILAQAQTPFAGIGYAAYGQGPRQLSPQDVSEVVRQILPIVPQIMGMLQSQPQMQHSAMHGGLGLGQFGGHPGQTQPGQMWGTQSGAPQFQAAFGGQAPFGQQRQLTQQDVADITRQLIGVIPQVIGNLQAYTQQRMI
ncbi:hypothetical protein NLM33_42885 [Bradyrhizobium sp. CCGUVB1N3]|uniref:hypothetical protein n=1 Tax=Bradyrhizobium sp. CCGUVB1N3 TaxID=2949629 RepID=UPI0020B44CE1|nr:hypothetical protein [Bradyrhizobium sp. CCGUVB1N3]MCP3476908.1 hypothetical protein [Bradyrhizobium sp. CCGUVB1N3]